MNYINFLDAYDIISIPKIQREYVQGNDEKGKTFMEDIFSAMKDKKEIQLDLVYGVNSENKYKNLDDEQLKSYEPIDGQQRLTTLFLLYWYIGKIENEGDIEKLKKFKYETRTDSKEFVEALCSKDIKITIEDKTSIKISQQPWFFDTYKYNPTVKAMLAMLDVIQECYMQYKNEFKTAISYDDLNKLVLCEFLDLGQYGLGEELYVIMNDRGKPLTAFENLKSTLDKCMENCGYYDKSKREDFIKKIDCDWTENLWKKPEANYDNELVDTLMYKFFCRYFRTLYMVDIKPELEDAKSEEKEYNRIIKKVESKRTDDENNKLKQTENKLEDYRKKYGEIIDKAIKYCDELNVNLSAEDVKEYNKKYFEYIFEHIVTNQAEANTFYDNMVNYIDFLLCNSEADKVMDDFFRPSWGTTKFVILENGEKVKNKTGKNKNNYYYKKKGGAGEKYVDESGFLVDNIEIEKDPTNKDYICIVKDDNGNIIQPQGVVYSVSMCPTNEISIFNKGSYSLVSWVINYALQLYIINNVGINNSIDISTDSYKHWKRFVWNIIEGQDVSRSIENVKLALNLITKYSEYTNDIENALASKDIQAQLDVEKNEKVKAEFVKADVEWYKLIYDAESHPYWKGYVQMLLQDLGTSDKEKFKKRSKICNELFNREGMSRENDYLLLRYFLLNTNYKCKDGKLETKKWNFTLSDKDNDNIKTQLKENGIWYNALVQCIDGISDDYDKNSTLSIETVVEDYLSKFIKDNCPNSGQKNMDYWIDKLINDITLFKNIMSSQNAGMNFACWSGDGDETDAFDKRITCGMSDSQPQIPLNFEYDKLMKMIESKGFKYINSKAEDINPVIEGGNASNNLYRFDYSSGLLLRLRAKSKNSNGTDDKYISAFVYYNNGSPRIVVKSDNYSKTIELQANEKIDQFTVRVGNDLDAII